MATGLNPAVMDRLIEALEGMGQRNDRCHRDFDAPIFTGKGDVELFIRQFTDVPAANDWSNVATLLHLRKALEKEAGECSRGGDMRDIFTSLRARYGMTAREARAKLAGLRRDSKTTLQEHSAEVEKLVGIAYAEYPGELRRTMSMDTFASTIGNGYLQTSSDCTSRNLGGCRTGRK